MNENCLRLLDSLQHPDALQGIGSSANSDSAIIITIRNTTTTDHGGELLAICFFLKCKGNKFWTKKHFSVSRYAVDIRARLKQKKEKKKKKKEENSSKITTTTTQTKQKAQIYKYTNVANFTLISSKHWKTKGQGKD